LVVLNGTATVYEIKSDRDNLTRLEHQLSSYRKVFALVNVVAAERFVDELLHKCHPNVGVLKLSDNFHLQTVRHATDGANEICPTTLFHSLRTTEASDALRLLGIKVPNVPNTLLRLELWELYKKQSPKSIHDATVEALKRSRSRASYQHLISELPLSLIAAVLTTPLSAQERGILAHAIRTPVATALRWT
jgi:hypothetical protein